MTKISNLPSDSSPTGDDYTVSVDTTSGQTKKVLLSDILSYVNNNTVPLMTNASNPYKFFAYLNATANLSSATQVLVFDAELFDTNNNYSTSTGRYTIPVTGYYFISCQALCNSLNDQLVASTDLYKNGSIIRRQSIYASVNGQDVRPSLEHVGFFTAGDYLQVYVSNNMGTRNWLGLTAAAYYASIFQGYMISAS